MLIGYTFYQRCALNTSLRILVCDRLDNYVVAKGRPTPPRPPFELCTNALYVDSFDSVCIIKHTLRNYVAHKFPSTRSHTIYRPKCQHTEHVNYNNAHPKNQQQQQKPLMCLLFFCGKQSSTQAEKRYTDTHTTWCICCET